MNYREFCGDGRTRTAVQTPHQAAFYMLIRPLVVGNGLPEGGLTEAYPLDLGGGQESRPRASGLNDTPGSEHNRPKVRGILVGGAALASRIKLID